MARDEREREGVRLDVWLDVACLYRTRSEGQKACQSGKVEMNGQAVKANRRLRVGDELKIKRPLGRHQRIVVRGLADRHIARADAKRLYEDLTPPPTADEIEQRRMERVYRAMTASGSPDKRQRRAIRKMKGRD